MSLRDKLVELRELLERLEDSLDDDEITETMHSYAEATDAIEEAIFSLLDVFEYLSEKYAYQGKQSHLKYNGLRNDRL